MKQSDARNQFLSLPRDFSATWNSEQPKCCGADCVGLVMILVVAGLEPAIFQL